MGLSIRIYQVLWEDAAPRAEWLGVSGLRVFWLRAGLDPCLCFSWADRVLSFMWLSVADRQGTRVQHYACELDLSLASGEYIYKLP